MKFSSMAFVVAAWVASAPAWAVDYTYTGTTAGAPVYNRPLSLTALSATGTAVGSSAFAFSVTAAGSYSFLSTVTYDNYTFLYTGSFSPTAPLTNLVALNDDFTSSFGITSGFTYTLAAATPYVFVNTGFANTDIGAFSTKISGPGSVVPVPEPETYALTALGLIGVALARRRAEKTS